MIRLYRRLIAWLLWQANGHPGAATYKSAFYAIKDRILTRYGKQIGYDVQEIEKLCWLCDGKGGEYRYGGYYDERDAEYPPRTWEDCSFCRGIGVFDRFWVKLEKHQLGPYRFHRPTDRTREVNIAQKWIAGMSSKNLIRGYVTHKDRPEELAIEAHLWLMLLYDRAALRHAMTWKRGSRRYPLSLVSHILCSRLRNDRGDLDLPF